MARILVFGASITYGAYDKEGGWVQRLRKFLVKKLWLGQKRISEVYNLGIPGDITEDVLERFEFETKQRLKEVEEIIIIFSIGTNDSQFVHSKNSLRTPQEGFKENIQKLINLSRKFTQKIIFVGLMPVDESRTTPIPWNKDKSYKNESIKIFNEIIKSVCQENNIYFVEILEDWLKSDYKNLLEDGLHPNSEGHQKIFERVKSFLIQKNII